MLAQQGLAQLCVRLSSSQGLVHHTVVLRGWRGRGWRAKGLRLQDVCVCVCV